MDAVINFFKEFSSMLPTIKVMDIVDILVVAFLIYKVIMMVRSTSAARIAKSVLIILILAGVTQLLNMYLLNYILDKILEIGLVALIVVFQPELRKALEDLGRRRLFTFLANLGVGKSISKRFEDKTINDMVMACFEMGAVKTGALIVVENQMRLDEVERTGITLDAVLTRQLLINIFEKNTPLHDGAIIVRGDRIVAATCYLPLSENMNLSKALGTRHRAALGISEVCDALTIVVSEETGRVSIAQNGHLTEKVTDDQLKEKLIELQNPVKDVDENNKPRLGRRVKDEAEHNS